MRFSELETELLIAAGVALALTIVALLAERRRSRRRDPDRVGIMPWGLVQALGLFATLILGVLAWKAR